MKTVTGIIWGIILVVLGVVIGLNTLEITDIDLFFDGWWTLFIIIPSFVGLFNDNDKTGNIIGLLVGGALLLACQNVITFDIIWKLSLPMILIIIGLSLLLKDMLNEKVNKIVKKMNKNDGTTYCATFSNQNININENEEFNGCTIEAVFGGVKCDLRNAKITEDVVIKASAIFGGIDILAPEGVNVRVSSTSIFGGGNNRHKNVKNDKAKTIYVNATNIFGGVDIK